MDESLCGDRPETEQNCPATERCGIKISCLTLWKYCSATFNLQKLLFFLVTIEYTWTLEDWTFCPGDCGQQEGDYTQTRNVTCMASDGIASWTEMDESLCGDRPETEQNCPATERCGIKILFFSFTLNPFTASKIQEIYKHAHCTIVTTSVFKPNYKYLHG